MIEEYTPDTNEVRNAYAWSDGDLGGIDDYLPEALEAFDRWLAAHDSEVIAKHTADEKQRELDQIIRTRKQQGGVPFRIGDEVLYTPTDETGIVRSIHYGGGSVLIGEFPDGVYIPFKWEDLKLLGVHK